MPLVRVGRHVLDPKEIVAVSAPSDGGMVRIGMRGGMELHIDGGSRPSKLHDKLTTYWANATKLVIEDLDD